MSQSDWDEQFDLFAINNFHERENAEGTGYDVSLEVKRITSGTTIANRPYVIRPKSYSEENPTMTIDMTDATLKPKQNCSISCSSMSYTYTFNGIYDATTLRTDASLMDYAMSGGSIMLAGVNATLSPQRWYLHVTPRDGYEEGGTSSSFAAIGRSISIDVTGNTEVTGIEDIHVVNTPSDGGGIYDLTGRKLAKEPAKGMYIKNNRVVFKLKD